MEIIEPTYFNTNVMFPYNIYHIRMGPDINFGGEEDAIIDVSTLTWTQTDVPNIYTNLLKFNLPIPNFDTYAKTKNGTTSLMADLILKQYPVPYVLGCIIYHQLQYTDPLEANFSTGMPNPSSRSIYEHYIMPTHSISTFTQPF
jgi:hypothetical protein